MGAAREPNRPSQCSTLQVLAANPARCFVHCSYSPVLLRLWTHLSDKDGLAGAGAPRLPLPNPSLGVALRDHNTTHSKGSNEPARMMTPFLARSEEHTSVLQS